VLPIPVLLVEIIVILVQLLQVVDVLYVLLDIIEVLQLPVKNVMIIVPQLDALETQLILAVLNVIPDIINPAPAVSSVMINVPQQVALEPLVLVALNVILDIIDQAPHV
jgi:hypothetical protein